MIAEERFDKAQRSIDAARLLVGSGNVEFAAGRACYAMFYVAEALLSTMGLQYGKHAAVHGAYGIHFAKTRELDPKFHRWLLEAFTARIEGDYGAGADFWSRQR